MNKQKLRSMYIDHKMSVHEIASELDRDPTIVYAWLLKHGIDTRGDFKENHKSPIGPLTKIVSDLPDGTSVYQATSNPTKAHLFKDCGYLNVSPHKIRKVNSVTLWDDHEICTACARKYEV